MTEDQIERAAERKFNALDARLMRGDLRQDEYDAESLRISEWCEKQYRIMDSEQEVSR